MLKNFSGFFLASYIQYTNQRRDCSLAIGPSSTNALKRAFNEANETISTNNSGIGTNSVRLESRYKWRSISMPTARHGHSQNDRVNFPIDVVYCLTGLNESPSVQARECGRTSPSNGPAISTVVSPGHSKIEQTHATIQLSRQKRLQNYRAILNKYWRVQRTIALMIFLG
jgi:hypothetical protein